jgi:AraC-like DNA-binding protein
MSRRFRDAAQGVQMYLVHIDASNPPRRSLRWIAERAPPPAASRCELRSVQQTAGGLSALMSPHAAQIVVPHSSLQVRVAGFAPLVANPCGVLLLEPGQHLTRVAIGSEGEIADVISLEPALAAQLARLAGLVGEAARGTRMFPGPWSRIGTEDFLALRMLIRAAPPPQEFESRLIAWSQRVLNTAAGECRRRPVPSRGPLAAAEPGRFDLAQGIAAYLDANWRRNVSLQELGDTFGLTSFYLLRAFRRAIGLTPHQYTLQLRLRRSLRMIESGRGRLVDIAVGLGFSSHGHFSTAFRASFGLTPAEYLGARRHGTGRCAPR